MSGLLTTLPSVIAALAFLGGMWQFFASTRLAFRKPYWEKQLALYIEICDCVALIATSEDEACWNAAVARFWRLYYGSLCLVENASVEEVMVALKPVVERTTFEPHVRPELRSLSLRLAHECRKSIAAGWRRPLKLTSLPLLAASVVQSRNASASEKKLSER